MSYKMLALARGALVIRQRAEDNLDEAARLFERAVDERRVMPRLGPAQVRRDGATAELRVEVEYGPVLGGYASDLRQLDKISGDDGQIEDFCRRELDSREALTGAVTDLIANLDDERLPPGTRLWVEVTLARLRQQFPHLAGEERRGVGASSSSTSATTE